MFDKKELKQKFKQKKKNNYVLFKNIEKKNEIFCFKQREDQQRFFQDDANTIQSEDFNAKRSPPKVLASLKIKNEGYGSNQRKHKDEECDGQVFKFERIKYLSHVSEFNIK